jgi:hypothetical protein
MQGSIDLPISNGWHVTLFLPAMWLLVVVVGCLAAVAVTALRTRSSPAWLGSFA